MKVARKAFFLGITFCFVFSLLSGVDRPWHPNQTYTIPDDGYTYTLDWSFSLTDDLLISGTLTILTTTDHVVALTNNYQITIETAGILNLSASGGTNGTDGGGGGSGTDGSDGKDVWLTNNGTVTIEGILAATGGNGGNGGDAHADGKGGDGGAGGAAQLSGTGNIDVSSFGILNLTGGVGGIGGDGAVSSGSNGGDGGRGGNATAEASLSLSIANNGIFNLSGGAGGTGGEPYPVESSSDGGRGGDGGSAKTKDNVTIASSGTLLVTGGDGGSGGRGSTGDPGDKFGGNGGNGGNATFNDNTTISVVNTTVTMIGGNGGTGGNERSNNGGDGGNGGTAGTSNNATFTLFYDSTLSLSGGDGAAGGDGTDGGIGGTGGSAIVTSSDTTIFELSNAINLTGGSGGDQGTSSGADGGDGGDTNIQFETLILSLHTPANTTVTTNITNGTDGAGASGGTKGTTLTGLVIEDGITAQSEPQPLYDPNLTISQTLSIDFTWTITQNQNIWGNGNTISIDTNGAIVINDNVSLHLDNLNITGVAGNNIRCMGNNATLEMNNVDWTQSANYSFTTGAINFYGDCTITGAWTTFSFQSTQPITIRPSGSLSIEADTTFEYNTTPANLFVITNQTGVLGLNDAAFVAAQNLTLQNGTLLTDGLAVVQGIGTFSLNGLNNIIVRGRISSVGDVVW